MSVKTIGQIFTEKYLKFIEESKPILGNKVMFPKLDEIDVEDLFCLIQVCFPNKDTKTNLQAVLKFKEITLNASQLKKLVVLVDEVIEFVDSIKDKI